MTLVNIPAACAELRDGGGFSTFRINSCFIRKNVYLIQKRYQALSSPRTQDSGAFPFAFCNDYSSPAHRFFPSRFTFFSKTPVTDWLIIMQLSSLEISFPFLILPAEPDPPNFFRSHSELLQLKNREIPRRS